ncbi:MAG: hypothetical protein WAU02_04820 [Candidatus Saccharimonadales bacterium]
MSRIISDILGYEPTYFANVLAQLERSVDGNAIDVALIGELASRSAAMHRCLNLDPADTTPHELYMVLRSRVVDDNQRLAGALGGTHPNAVSEMTPLIMKAIRTHVGRRECWAMKPAVAKSLLRAHPPKSVMAALGYRSVASLLKHEPVSHIMVAARYVESSAWNQSLTKLYDRLTPRDFESRPIEVGVLDKAVYVQPLMATHRRHHLVLHSKEMGCVLVAPTREKVVRGYTLRTVALLLHYVAEISMMSSLLKYRHAGSDYGAAVIDALIGDTTGHIQLADHPVHWRSLHRHVAVAGHDLGPHMQDSDWHYESTNDALARLIETMVLWANLGHVATHDTQPVGYNLVDLAIDASHDVPFAERSLRYLRRELETELFRRYLTIAPLRHLTLRRFNID